MARIKWFMDTAGRHCRHRRQRRREAPTTAGAAETAACRSREPFSTCQHPRRHLPSLPSPVCIKSHFTQAKKSNLLNRASEGVVARIKWFMDTAGRHCRHRRQRRREAPTTAGAAETAACCAREPFSTCQHHRRHPP